MFPSLSVPLPLFLHGGGGANPFGSWCMTVRTDHELLCNCGELLGHTEPSVNFLVCGFLMLALWGKWSSMFLLSCKPRDCQEHTSTHGPPVHTQQNIAESHGLCRHYADLSPPTWLPFTSLWATSFSLVHSFEGDMEHCPCAWHAISKIHGAYALYEFR